MKLSLILAILCLSISSAMACSPAPTIVMQKQALERALNASAFTKLLSAEMGRDYSVSIQSIKINGDVVVALSNSCRIIVKTTYRPVVDNGMCPQVDKVTAMNTCRR